MYENYSDIKYDTNNGKYILYAIVFIEE